MAATPEQVAHYLALAAAAEDTPYDCPHGCPLVIFPKEIAYHRQWHRDEAVREARRRAS